MLDVLNLNKLDWQPIDKDHIKVLFSGHFDDNYAQLESDLERAGLHAVRRTYDKKINKTTTIYKVS